MTRTFGSAARVAALAALLPCLSAPAVRAADRPMPPAPPPEAVSACAGKAAQDACQLTFGGQAEPGTCAALADGTLACRPSHPPPPHGPPPEAIQACSGYIAGEACAVTLGGDTLDGVCEQGPGGSELACRPTKLPPPPGR
jgi:hypothetical protein